MTYTYATTPANVVTDAVGNVVTGWRIDVYDARTGGTKITDLETLNGTALPGYVTTDSGGRYEFLRTAETIPVLWADDGQSGTRWALVANEVMISAATAASDANQAASDASGAQQSASDAAASATAAAASAATADAALTDLNDYQQTTPTVEELVFSTYIPGVCNTAGDQIVTSLGFALDTTLMVVPIGLKLLSVGLSWDLFTLAANDTDYWTVALKQYPFGQSDTVIASRTTQITGAVANGGITPRTPWTFDGVDLTPTTFAAQDLLALVLTPTGVPPDIHFGFTVTTRYMPV